MTGTDIAVLNDETPEEALLRMKTLLDETLTDNVILRRSLQATEARLMGEMLGRQEDATKRRDREAALAQELRAAHKGVKTGCVCPAGKCLKLNEDGSMCWAEWAGLKAVRDAAQAEIDKMMRASDHPRRYVRGNG